MPFLADPESNSMILDPATIELKAHVYYSDVFSRPSDEFRAADESLSEESKLDQTMQ